MKRLTFSLLLFVIVMSNLPISQSDAIPTYSILDLGTLGGSFSTPTGINDFGQVAGASKIISGDIHAFLYSDGKMLDLGTFGGLRSWADDINDSGQVVGNLTTVTGDPHAFLYDTTNGMQDLGTLGGSYSSALKFNASGRVIGLSETANGEYHAFLYNGKITDLGTLGGDSSTPSDINDLGQVVGTARNTNGQERAFLYSSNVMYDLNSLIPIGSGWELTMAGCINDVGQIAGHGYINNEIHAFIMTPAQVEPIPEPSTIILMSCGLLGLLGIVIRHRRKDTRSR